MQIWPGYSDALSPSVAPSSETIPWPRPVLSFPVAILLPLPAESSHTHSLPWESEIQLRCHLHLYPPKVHETKRVTPSSGPWDCFAALPGTRRRCSLTSITIHVPFFFPPHFSPYHINWYFISIFKTWSHLYLTTLIWKGNSGSPLLMASLLHPQMKDEQKNKYEQSSARRF